MTAQGGGADATGSLDLKLNPPEPQTEEGVSFSGAWVRAELDDGKLTVRVSGQAEYLGRTLTQSIDLSEELIPLKHALQQILNAYEPTVKAKVLRAAFEAHTVAVNRHEHLNKKTKEE